MSEKELQHLYDLLKKVKDEEEKEALRHAIFIIEQYNHVYQHLGMYIRPFSLAILLYVVYYGYIYNIVCMSL